jgi:hypothetical protein
MDGGASVVMMREVGANKTVIAITNYQPLLHSFFGSTRDARLWKTYIIDHNHL